MLHVVAFGFALDRFELVVLDETEREPPREDHRGDPRDDDAPDHPERNARDGTEASGGDARAEQEAHRERDGAKRSPDEEDQERLSERRSPHGIVETRRLPLAARTSRIALSTHHRTSPRLRLVGTPARRGRASSSPFAAITLTDRLRPNNAPGEIREDGISLASGSGERRKLSFRRREARRNGS